MSKKSLAEELAELANPAPTKGKYIELLLMQCVDYFKIVVHLSPWESILAEYDPDADLFGSGPALEEFDDELLVTTKRK